MRIRASIHKPIRKGLSTEELWKSVDNGLIAAWERGREVSEENPEFAALAKAGELVLLPWKGGVEQAVNGIKYGTTRYLAMWQGLRGDDLDIDRSAELQLTCSRTGVTVHFSEDTKKQSGRGK